MENEKMFNLTTKAYIKATEAVRNFKNNEDGVTAIEYDLIAAAKIGRASCRERV